MATAGLTFNRLPKKKLSIFPGPKQYIVTFLYFTAADCFTIHDAYKAPDGFSTQIFTGVMALVMGIVTMIRLTRTMPKKFTDANLYPGPIYCVDAMIKSHPYAHQLPAPVITGTEFLAFMKRMAEMEDRVSVLSVKPTAMPADKEDLLNAALIRIDTLERELAATKKVPHCWLLLSSVVAFIIQYSLKDYSVCGFSPQTESILHNLVSSLPW